MLQDSDLLFNSSLIVFQDSFMFPLRLEIFAEKYRRLSWIFRELTLFQTFLYASMGILDLLLRVSGFILSLVLVRRLSSLPTQGHYLSEMHICFKGACFFMIKENKEGHLLASMSLSSIGWKN